MCIVDWAPVTAGSTPLSGVKRTPSCEVGNDSQTLLNSSICGLANVLLLGCLEVCPLTLLYWPAR